MSHQDRQQSTSISLRRNVELKARLDSLPAARDVAQQLATQPPRTQVQTDTYFNCRQGRLKLREIQDQFAQLIWYARDNEPRPRTCDYQLLDVEDPASLRQMLAGALGIRGVVRKQREIYLHHNVRIHLDRVEELGTFLEFEAVMRPAQDVVQGEAQLRELSERFAITPDQLLSQSYGDLILAR